MTYNSYNPLVYQSFGAPDSTNILSSLGNNYGYEGAYDPRKHPNLTAQGKYAINGQVFRSQGDYDKFNETLGSRASFLDDQSRTNPAAYAEFVKNPYAFQGNSPFKTAAQKAAEIAAVKASASTRASGGTSSTIVGQAPAVGGLNPNRGLPSIPGDNNALLTELKALLGDIPELFDTKELVQSFKDRGSFDESSGRQAANSAASEFASRTRAEGGDASLSGLVRAQALLPVLKQQADLRGELADKKLQINSAKGTLTSSVAEALGRLRTGYLTNLVDYTGKINDIRNTNLLESNRLKETGRQFDLSHSLDLSKIGLAEKDNKLQALLALAKLNKDKIDPRKNTYYPGITEGGPIDPFKQEYNDDLESILSRLGAMA